MFSQIVCIFFPLDNIFPTDLHMSDFLSFKTIFKKNQNLEIQNK